MPSGTNESDTWGPNGHPAEVTDIYASTLGSALDGDTANEYLHWDGNAIAYSSSNYVNGLGTSGANGVDQVFIGNFATYVPSTFPGGGHLTVDFRDQSGTGLSCQGTPFSEGACSALTGNTGIYVPISQPRADGYQIGMTTIQGVRAYDPGSAQWTTPDAYAGLVSDPMSQQSYMWNGNNPIAYGDPSGFKAKHENVNTMDLSAGPCGTSPNSTACQKQIEYILHQENLQLSVFKGYLVLMTSPLTAEGGPAVSRLANFAAFGSSEGRVFWSGYEAGAQDAAEALAKGDGGKTLEMTPAGRIAGSLPRSFQRTPVGAEIWKSLSRGFASGAEGEVKAVIRVDRG